MKTWGIVRNFLCIIFTVLCLIYAGVYFVAPYFINKKDISLLITKNIEKQTGLVVLIDNHKVSMSPKLEVKLCADNISVFYPNKKQFLDADKVEVELSLLSLLKKEICIKNIRSGKFQFSTKLLANGKTSIQEYLEKNIAQDSEKEYKFSSVIPTVHVADYLLKIKDEKTSQRLKIEGQKLTISQNPDLRYYTISTKGNLFVSNEKRLSYNTKLEIPKDLTKIEDFDFSSLSLDTFFKQKYTADINADLKLFSKKSVFDYANGNILIDNFVFYIADTPLPPSYFHVKTNKGKAFVDSKFYTNQNEITDINAVLKIKKPYSANLTFSCPRADIANLQKLSIAVLNLLNIKNNLADFNVKGILKADFSVIADTKSLKSSGRLKIANASLTHKAVPLNINEINALVDFSDNKLDIKKSSALVNNQPININGYVLSDATGKLTAKAENLDLKNIISAFPTVKINKDISLKSGKLSFTADISGKLAEAVPVVNAVVKNLSGGINSLNATFNTGELKVFSKLTKNKPSGEVVLNNFAFFSTGATTPVSLKSDKIKAVFDDKNLKLEQSKLTTGNANLTLFGEIKNYAQKPDVSLTLKGTADTNFLKSLAPKGITLQNKGYLPVRTLIRSIPNSKSYDIDLKVLANPENFITPITVQNFHGKTTLTHLQAIISEKDLTLKDFSIYYAGNINNLVNDINPSSLKKSISIKGKIKNYLANPDCDNLKIVTFEQLKTTIPDFKDSSISLLGELNINGALNGTPSLNGYLQIDNAELPQYSLSMGSSLLNFKNHTVTSKLNNVKIADTALSLEAAAEIPHSITEFNKINSVKINAEYIDLEKTIALLQKMFRAKYAPGADIPVDILSGKLFIKKFKMDVLEANNITADFTQTKNELHLNNLYAGAYGGKIAGKVTYNLPYTSIKAVFQGRGLSAETATTALMPKEQKITGVLDFDADISTIGNSFEQQMKALSGRADFIIKNGHFAQLGRFEHFLYAQNLLSQKLINTNLNTAKQAISPQDTGRFSSMKGMAKFAKGYVHLNPVTTSGPQMSMYITGRINMLTNEADLKVLGKVSSEVSSSLGLLGKMTIKDFFNEHTKYGNAFSEMFDFCNTELPEIDISRIPELSPDLRYQTKNFQVLLNGNMSSVKAVKSFTWVNPIGYKKKVDSELSAQENLNANSNTNANARPVSTPQAEQPARVETTQTPDFLDNIPDNFN